MEGFGPGETVAIVLNMIAGTVPPLLLLLIWFIGSWVLRGFKRRD